MPDNAQRSTPVVIRKVLTDPHWWFKDVLMALILGTLISGGSIIGQMIINDHRVAREDARVEAENLHSEQLANLRYVRDGSSPDPNRSRPYSYFNLEGKDLVGLQLAGADFAFANLADTHSCKPSWSVATSPAPIFGVLTCARLICAVPTSAWTGCWSTRTNPAPTSPAPT
jgi:hypothetical protein